MKYQLQSIQKFNAILSVLHHYHNCFAAIPVFEDSLQQLSINTAQMSKLITSLTVPVKSVSHLRISARHQMLEEFARFLQISFVIADESERNTLHGFVRDYRSVSGHQLMLYATYLLQIIGQHPEAAANAGITPQEILQLHQAIQNYESAINQVASSFDQRKRNRRQIQTLTTKNNQILRNTFDRYLKSKQSTYSDFYKDYRFARFKQYHKSNQTKTPEIINIAERTITKPNRPTIHQTTTKLQIPNPMPQLILNLMFLSRPLRSSTLSLKIGSINPDERSEPPHPTNPKHLQPTHFTSPILHRDMPPPQ